MRIPKRECKVNIFCMGGSLIHGMIHVSEGLRVLDSLNDTREGFIAVTKAKISGKKPKANSRKKSVLMVHKAAIEWLEEV